MKKRKAKKEQTGKKVNYQIIEDRESEPYKLLNEALGKWHEDLYRRGARIALAWRTRQKPDLDGHLILGRCVKVGDLQKEFAAYDFIIVLNREVWDSPDFGTARKLALVDHELCHAAVSYNEETGEPKYDERDRPVFRIVKHDIEEFRAVVARHGCYKGDLEAFAETLLKKKGSGDLFPQKFPAPRLSGSVANQGLVS